VWCEFPSINQNGKKAIATMLRHEPWLNTSSTKADWPGGKTAAELNIFDLFAVYTRPARPGF
jgi:hypothetical protein